MFIKYMLDFKSFGIIITLCLRGGSQARIALNLKEIIY